MQDRTNTVLALLAFTVTALAAVMFIPPIAQDPHYHQFADSRSWHGVPNFGDVVSNIALFMAGLVGCLFMLRSTEVGAGKICDTRGQWWAYMMFFVGGLLTGIGSTYYHWAPTAERLVWDRLPMTIAFMSIFAAILADRVHTRIATFLLVPLLLLGVGTVYNWQMTEHLGLGDLRLYAFVQFFPLVCMPVIFFTFKSQHSRQPLLFWSLAFYAMAKVTEHYDVQILDVVGISGHTIKHVLSGLAIFMVVPYLCMRSVMRSTV